LKLFDTHTHFDVPDFDPDREQLAYAAKAAGVEHLVLIGFLQNRFADLLRTHQFINDLENAPQSHLAPGLHPFYIEQHQTDHLQELEQLDRKSVVEGKRVELGGSSAMATKEPG